MKTALVPILAGLILTAATATFASSWDFDRESYEEDAGSNFLCFFSPEHTIYGIGYGSGTWLRNVPIFGDYSARLYYNGIEKAVYSGVGMTLRVMPRWTWAPFVGAGGHYNYSITQESLDPDERLPSRGDSYWSGHAEGGFRLWLRQRSQFFDVAYRQTWSSLKGERDYALVVLGFGVGAAPQPAWR